ncbi:hypothetical protein BO70DRAFT_398355 [Aspergillus heteromorphus CBS 117.55]|uniref:Hydrophobic surface binding protein A n=1 Tax=Aspergillus heteromorphus CBS 117.55 TaxID=1448321 RepID=A0A317VPG9_9EURO|nr:uncharacterized protein BO70DRAFT_398355 [Aspergillus heteromorphus CBS 117.55]PWY75509.1 hypothetical protein BO70DRAFT_398355 [Aspergillus heteromorphus CBS 117.55]
MSPPTITTKSLLPIFLLTTFTFTLTSATLLATTTPMAMTMPMTPLLTMLLTTITTTYALPTLISDKTTIAAAPADAIISAIHTLATDYTTLYSDVKAITATEQEYNTALAAESVVEHDIRHVIEAAASAEPLNADSSKKVLEATELPYPDFMSDLLGAFKGKAETVATLGKTYEVRRILENLNHLSDSLVVALQNKVVKEDVDSLAAGRKWVDQLFSDTIHAFGS